MITRNSSYSELATLKAMYEERTFFWLEVADQKVREFSKTNDAALLSHASSCHQWAYESYSQAVFAHTLMSNYWNS